MFKSRGIFAALACGIILSGACAGKASAADKGGVTVVIGTVNVEQVFNDSNNKKKLDGELQAFKDQLRQRLELRNNNRLLADDEYKQLADLTFKATPTDDDKKKATELTTLATQREQEYAALQQKKDATDADKAKLAQYQDGITKVQASLKSDVDKAEGDLANKTVELSRQVMDQVQAAVSDVAKAKGMTLVLNKVIGDTMFVMYSGVDITSDVLDKLNKK